MTKDKQPVQEQIANLCRIMRQEGKIRRFTPEGDAQEIIDLFNQWLGEEGAVVPFYVHSPSPSGEISIRSYKSLRMEEKCQH